MGKKRLTPIARKLRRSSTDAEHRLWYFLRGRRFDGAKFVRGVVDVAGMDGFNKVWDHAGNLPTEEEIHDSKLWLERMGL